MRRNRVVNECADAAGLEESLQGIALGAADHEEVPRRTEIVDHLRQRDAAADVRQTLAISPCDEGAAGVPFVEPRELHTQECGLERIEAGVVPLDLVLVLYARPVVAQDRKSVV